MFENIVAKLKKIFQKSYSDKEEVCKKREHIETKCEYCQTKSICGDRFSCTICPNYNLCSECYCSDLKNKKHELNHPCLLITYPSQTYLQDSSLQNLIETNKYKDFNIKCDLCESKIIGIYLKCNKCYCTFICLECWRNEKHDKKHPIICYNSVRLEKFNLDDLKLEKMLDNGNYGYVYEAFLKPHNQLVACKLMNKKFFSKLSFKNLDLSPRVENAAEKKLCIDKELEAYIEIFSPFVCKLLGYGRDQTKRMFLVMEYLENGSLEDFIFNSKKKNNEIPLILKLRIMLNIASGLSDIHSKNFIHADIKPKNILLDSNYVAKICDLGSIKNLNLCTNNYDNNTGGLYYLPLEFFVGKYDNKIDIYSFGLILYHLFSGSRHSYRSNNSLVLNKFNKIPLIFIRNLIIKATSMNPTERKTILYYRNILHMYIKLLEDLLRMFELIDIDNHDLVIISLNDYILEFINFSYNAKLELNNTSLTLAEKSLLDADTKIKLDKAINFLNMNKMSIKKRTQITNSSKKIIKND